MSKIHGSSSLIVEQKYGTIFLKKLEWHRPFIASRKIFRLLSLFLIIVVDFCNSFVVILCTGF